MLGSTSRTRLRGLRERLQLLRSRLPERAAHFHELARQQENRIDRIERRWWKPWPTPSELELIEIPVHQLEQMVEPLSEVIGRAEELAEQASRLEPQASEMGDPQLEEWLHERRRVWQAELKAVGRRAADIRLLSQDARMLDRREEELRLCAQVCYQLKRAAELVVTPNLGEEGTALALELSALRQEVREELRRSGPATEQVERLKRLVQPLERLAEQLRKTNSRLEGLGEQLQELRGWSRRLDDALRPQIQALEDGRQRLAFAPPGEETAVEKWLAQVEALHGSLVEQAREQRRDRLEMLESGMLELADACGPQPELVVRITELRSAVVERHHQHAEWLQKLDRYQGSFQSIAKNHERALEERLRAQLERLDGKLHELSQKTLSSAVRTALDQIENELRELRRLGGVHDVLQGLRNTKKLEREIAELDRQAEQELQDLVEKRKTLELRFDEIKAQEARLGFELEDLGPQIAELVASQKQLEEVRNEAVELEARVDARHRLLLERCRQWLTEHEQAAQEMVQLLELVGEGPGIVIAAGVIVDEATPTDATEAALAAEVTRRELEASVEAALANFEARRLEIAAEIAALEPASLRPSERADAEQIRRELEGGSWSRERDAQARLELLAELVRKCDLLFERLHQDEIRVRKRREDLLERLRRFDEAMLRRYCPELTERVEALLHGVSERTRRWSAALHQLEQAGELLGRLETHGRRLAVAELERGLSLLKEQPESRTHNELRTLLARLAEMDPHELPVTSLRMKVRQEAERFEEVS